MEVRQYAGSSNEKRQGKFHACLEALLPKVSPYGLLEGCSLRGGTAQVAFYFAPVRVCEYVLQGGLSGNLMFSCGGTGPRFALH
jgi:hypothetical protein